MASKQGAFNPSRCLLGTYLLRLLSLEKLLTRRVFYLHSGALVVAGGTEQGAADLTRLAGRSTKIVSVYKVFPAPASRAPASLSPHAIRVEVYRLVLEGSLHRGEHPVRLLPRSLSRAAGSGQVNRQVIFLIPAPVVVRHAFRNPNIGIGSTAAVLCKIIKCSSSLPPTPGFSRNMIPTDPNVRIKMLPFDLGSCSKNNVLHCPDDRQMDQGKVMDQIKVR